MPILPEHKEILASQSASKTLPEWLEFFNNEYTRGQVYSFCYHNNYKIKKVSQEQLNRNQSLRSRKYHINEDYFKTWSRNMAYVFGLWFADGCIYRGRLFDITLHKKDKYVLKKVAEEFEYEGPLLDYVDRQAARLNFSCKVMYDDLVALGGTERKNNTAVFPEVPDEYLADFIRGYFDGDGCACLLKNGRLNVSFCSGSKQFLDVLHQKLREHADVVGGSYDPYSRSLRFGKKDSYKIGEFMYKNDPEIFLLRKRKKFEGGNL